MRHDDPAWLADALAGLPALCVTVFGDFCLDAYWQLDEGAAELSLETGLPVQRVRTQRYGLGGAANVVANLLDLGVGQVRAIGLVGTDPFGAELMRQLDARGADTRAGMLEEASWQTLVYAKPFSGDAEERRVDFGSFNELAEPAAAALLAALEDAARASQVVVLNQQIALGLSTAPLIARLNELIARQSGTLFLADSRHRPERFVGAALKLNSVEAARYLGVSPAGGLSADRVQQFAAQIAARTGQCTFITRGEHGIVAADRSGVHAVPGIQILGRTDAVGAGDTVVAALAAMLGGGQSAHAAAKVANIAAMITASKLKMTGTATPPEILAAGADPDYVYAPELAATPQLAQFAAGTRIEMVRALPANLAVKVCIFDHDGTLSTLRAGWETIMSQMMLRAILGAAAGQVEPARVAQIRGEVDEFINHSTGMQTLAQMQGLVGMVRRFGLARQDEILGASGYKDLFSRELLKIVHRRIEQLRTGELDPAQFRIGQALQFLRELHRRGITLYLASGTDHADVVAEARALGYADYFEGRIYGAVDDLNADAKKTVLDRMHTERKLSGHEFVMFGDGPMEIRETRKRAAVAVGVASDEAHSAVQGANRKRLIRAGADLIIEDFGCWQDLLQLLRI